MKVANVLSLDGGGIRGIIPVIVLNYIEKVLRHYDPSRHLHQYFDVISGTSTGGLIALGIGSPLLRNTQTKVPKYSPQSLLSIYVNKGNELFTRKDRKWLSGFSTLYRYKYSIEFMSNLMEEIYGEATLSDAMTPLLITAFDMQNMKPHFFRSAAIQKDPKREDFFIKDVARATSAAPTYFPAAKIKSCPPHSRTYGLVDGGVFANNPGMLAVLEARTLYPEVERFNVISIGTGYTKRSHDIDDVESWGIYQWMSPGKNVPLLTTMMSGQSDTVHFTLSSLENVNYYRFNILLDPERSGMDDVSPENIAYLQHMGHRCVSDNKALLHQCIKQIVASASRNK